jgi:hypothetical protein
VTARGSRLLLLVAALAAFVLPGTARAATDGIGALRICTGCAQAGGDLSRYGYVVLNSWDAPLLPALKAANPGLKALVYKNLSFTVSYGCVGGSDLPYQTTGVGYCYAGSQHPEWFLTDPAGNRLNSAGYPQAWMMDVGSPGYQSTWLTNVLADLRSGGWDGVFMDDTDADMGWHLNGRTIARYPTSASWRTATRSMLATVGPALTSAGFLAVPNLYAPWAADYDAQATWSDWIRFTSGAAQEYYSKWGTSSSGWFAGSDWTYRQAFQPLTEEAGKIFLGITYAPKDDTHSMSWARSNFLLFHEGASGSALLFEATDPEAQDPYASSWTVEVGTPLGARFQVGSAWRRNFSGGTVLVNPTSSTLTVQLEKPYLRDDGSATSSVTLGPTSGAILRTTVEPAPQPPPPPPPPSAEPSLTASVSGTSVRLAWRGLIAARVDIFRDGTRAATASNKGSYTDKLPRKTSGTFSYRVCGAGTATCTPTATVAVGMTVSSAVASKKRKAHPTSGSARVAGATRSLRYAIRR